MELVESHSPRTTAPPADATWATLVFDEHIEDCDPEACGIWRCPRDALLGRDIVDISSPTQRDAAPSHDAFATRCKAAYNGLPQAFEWRFRRADGEPFDGLVTLEAAPADTRHRLVARVRDLTFLSRAERALRDSESRLQQILDNTTAIVYVKDKEGRHLLVNRQFERLFHLREAELLGKRDCDVFPASVASAFRNNDVRVLQAKVAMEFEEAALLEDGEHTYLSIKFPLFDSAGEVYAVCGISTDITQRKKTEQALRNVAVGVTGVTGGNIFRELVRHLAIALGVDVTYIGKLVDGGCDRVETLAVYDRGQFLENLEYDLANTPCAEVIGKHFQYIPNRVRERFPGDSMLNTLGFESYAAYPLFDSQGTALGLIVAIDRKPLQEQTITEALLKIFSVRAAAELERARLERQLRQAQKMEAIGHLTGGIAHDFNNILTGVMGYILLAKERAAPLNDAKLDKYLDRAHHSGERARDLIRQMLTFSRGQHGEPRPLALGEVVKESVRLLRSSLPSSIELWMDIGTEKRPVMLDPVQVEQILMNLCINARDAMNGSGRIAVSLSAATCDNEVCASCHQTFSGQFVVISVNDSGPGIPVEYHDRIFEPFFTTKDTGKGSGMGLSTVHGIVHENGGHIIVHTAPGRGAAFQVLFKPVPAAQTNSQPRRSKTEKTKGSSPALRGRVLVVDDDEAAGEFMRDLLTHWGLRVRLVRGGVEARELFAVNSRGFDLAVLDQTMPQMTGVDLAKHLLALRPDLPIILYTGYSESLSDELIRSSGVRALIRKPVDVNKLRSLINDLSTNILHEP